MRTGNTAAKFTGVVRLGETYTTPTGATVVLMGASFAGILVRTARGEVVTVLRHEFATYTLKGTA